MEVYFGPNPPEAAAQNQSPTWLRPLGLALGIIIFVGGLLANSALYNEMGDLSFVIGGSSFAAYFLILLFGSYCFKPPAQTETTPIHIVKPSDLEANIVNLEDLPAGCYLTDKDVDWNSLYTLAQADGFNDFLTTPCNEYNDRVVTLLESQGFTPLPEYGFEKKVITHPLLNDWFFKGDGDEDTTKHVRRVHANKYDNLMRVAMGRRMGEVVEKFDLNIQIPEERLFKLQVNGENIKPHKKFILISRKLNVFGYEDTKRLLKTCMEVLQRKMAKDLCTLIIHTGWMDANLTNILLCKNELGESSWKLAVVDCESVGLLREASDNEPRSTLTTKLAAINGLKKLQEEIGEREGFPIFAEEAQNALSLLVQSL